MLRKRVIVCLDVDGGRVVKGTQFEDLRDQGDPVELAARYEAQGADEILLLDISASVEKRSTVLDAVRRTARRLSIPLTVGGGISTVEHVGEVLRAGADKVAVNTAAVNDPALITRAAERYGSQCVVASIDARRDDASFRVYTHGGRMRTMLDAIDWAEKCATLGAGELVITSIDRDGTCDGFDVQLTRAVVDSVAVPVIASGGAGSPVHFVDAFAQAEPDGALAAGMFHDGTTTVAEVKRTLASKGIFIREYSDEF